MYASVLAPTDTVATISMTRSLDIMESIYFQCIENESVMNDAISVVLVRLFRQIDESDHGLSKWTPLSIVFWSLLTTCVSIMFGMFVGVVLNRVSTKSLTMHYLCALLVYGVSECLGLSGILGLFTYGAVLKPPEAFRESVSSISL